MRGIDYTLYLVTDRKLADNRPMEQIVGEAIRGGVTIVQLREKDLPNKDVIEQAYSLKSVTDRLGVPLIINDRIEIATACGAAGVHLGQEDMSCAEARRIAGKRLIIGISVSTPEEAILAEEAGADYLGISPVFPTTTKTDTPSPSGLVGVLAIRKAVRIPLVGIGGINMSNAAEVIRSGTDGVAVVSAIMAAPDPRLAARRLRSALRREDAGMRARTRD